jgi:sulfite reductase alpha subunit-like flavoprotein
MKNIIKKILKEEFKNQDTQSNENNICDVMSINSVEEIIDLLKKMPSVKDNKYEIISLIKDLKKEKYSLSNDLDILNTYLRKIQNILCK